MLTQLTTFLADPLNRLTVILIVCVVTGILAFALQLREINRRRARRRLRDSTIGVDQIRQERLAHLGRQQQGLEDAPLHALHAPFDGHAIPRQWGKR